MKYKKSPFSSQWGKAMNRIISQEMYFGKNYTDSQSKKKLMKFNLGLLKWMVKTWEMSDVEKVEDILSHKKEKNPEEFSKQFFKVIYPLVKTKSLSTLNIDEICHLLSKAIDKRMCQESSRYSLWE